MPMPFKRKCKECGVKICYQGFKNTGLCASCKGKRAGRQNKKWVDNEIRKPKEI